MTSWELHGDISPPRCGRCCCSSGSRTGSLGFLGTTEAPRCAWAGSDSGSRLLCLTRCSHCWRAPSLLHEREQKKTGASEWLLHFQTCNLGRDLPSCFMMFNRDLASSRPVKREHRRSGLRERLSCGVLKKKKKKVKPSNSELTRKQHQTVEWPRHPRRGNHLEALRDKQGKNFGPKTRFLRWKKKAS